MKKANRRQLKNIRKLLKEKKVRDFEGFFIAEGEKIIKDLFLKKCGLDSVFVSSSYAKSGRNKKFILDLEKEDISVYEIGEVEFEKISALQRSQGILSVIKRPKAPECPSPDKKSSFIVLCDGIQDPGNLGTIIRTSVALGADSVLLLGDCADIFNPKVVRASSGAVLDIPVVRCDLACLDRLRDQGHQLLASQVGGKKSTSISTIKNISLRCIVAFGSEGKGISKDVLKRADRLFFIPISEKIESLNVTSAVAISLQVFRGLKRKRN